MPGSTTGSLHRIRVKNTDIRVVKGDITQVCADAIVNAANNALWMGGGVAGAIKARGGKEIEDEAVRQGPVPVGEAVVTKAGRLRDVQYVIHAAVMGTDLVTSSVKIRNATNSTLARAEELGIKSIAFPALGTGVGGFPLDHCAKIMIEAVKEHVEQGTALKTITFVLFEDEAYKAFDRELHLG